MAILGLATDAQLIATFIGAIDVGLAFWMLGRLPLDRTVRVGDARSSSASGTVLWYAAELGSTWYLAHVVAVGLTLAADRRSRSGADPRAAERRRPGAAPLRAGAGDGSGSWASTAASSWPGSCSGWPARPG